MPIVDPASRKGCTESIAAEVGMSPRSWNGAYVGYLLNAVYAKQIQELARRTRRMADSENHG